MHGPADELNQDSERFFQKCARLSRYPQLRPAANEPLLAEPMARTLKQSQGMNER
jgi:hypothetical protein